MDKMHCFRTIMASAGTFITYFRTCFYALQRCYISFYSLASDRRNILHTNAIEILICRWVCVTRLCEVGDLGVALAVCFQLLDGSPLLCSLPIIHTQRHHRCLTTTTKVPLSPCNPFPTTVEDEFKSPHSVEATLSTHSNHMHSVMTTEHIYACIHRTTKPDDRLRA